MFCSKCGAQNGDGGAFCIQCGTPLQNVPQQAPIQQAPVQQNAYYSNAGYNPMNQTQVMTAPVKKPNYTLIGIISVAVVAVIVVVVVLLLSGGKSSLVGTWSLSEYGVEMSLKFKSNGVVETDSFGEIELARYMTKGNMLIIIDEDGYEQEGEYRIYKNGGKTLLDMSFEGMTLTLVKK